MGDQVTRLFFGIPTVTERFEYAKELAAQIGADSIFLDAKHNGCLWNKIRIYDYAIQNGYSHACINDDDSICCDNYRQIVQKCTDLFPDSILTFFYNKPIKSQSTFVRRPNCQLSGTAFVMPLKFVPEYKKFYADHLAKYRFDWEETTTKMFALMNDIEVILVMPNLVTVREGLVTTARKGKWIQKPSPHFVQRFPEDRLDANDIKPYDADGLFNLHLPKGCDTANMIVDKWERIKHDRNKNRT